MKFHCLAYLESFYSDQSSSHLGFSLSFPALIPFLFHSYPIHRTKSVFYFFYDSSDFTLNLFLWHNISFKKKRSQIKWLCHVNKLNKNRMIQQSELDRQTDTAEFINDEYRQYTANCSTNLVRYVLAWNFHPRTSSHKLIFHQYRCGL